MARSPVRSTNWGQTLATGVFCVAFLTLFQRIIGLGRSFVVCDWLPTEELGKWDLAFTFLMAVGPLMVLGVPGAFGRFADSYRKENRIGRFIRITAAACGLIFAVNLVGLFVLWQMFGRHTLSATYGADWFFALVLTLAIVVIFNYLTALMSALRLHQGFARVQVVHGIGFAVLCLGMLPICSYQAIGVVAAYGVACILSSIAAVIWLRRSLAQHELSVQQPCNNEAFPDPADSRGIVAEFVDVMRAVLPFALAIWFATLIANAFRVSDRMLIVQLSANAPVGLYFVGQLHAARVIPRLLGQFAMTLTAVITPHLAEDWDQGDTARASERLGSILKFVSISYCALGVGVVALAPFVSTWFTQDKFDLALKLLPWSMASGIMFSLAFVLQNAFWCCKQTRWTSISFLIGLVVNVAVGLILFPSFGIEGIVISTFLATAASFLLLLYVASKIGFRFSAATYLLLALPSALTSQTVGCLLVLLVVIYALLVPDTFVTASERGILRKMLRR